MASVFIGGFLFKKFCPTSLNYIRTNCRFYEHNYTFPSEAYFAMAFMYLFWPIALLYFSVKYLIMFLLLPLIKNFLIKIIDIIPDINITINKKKKKRSKFLTQR